MSGNSTDVELAVLFEKIETITEKLDDLKSLMVEVVEMRSDINQINYKIDKVRTAVDNLTIRVGKVEVRCAEISETVNQMTTGRKIAMYILGISGTIAALYAALFEHHNP